MIAAERGSGRERPALRGALPTGRKRRSGGAARRLEVGFARAAWKGRWGAAAKPQKGGRLSRLLHLPRQLPPPHRGPRPPSPPRRRSARAAAAARRAARWSGCSRWRGPRLRAGRWSPWGFWRLQGSFVASSHSHPIACACFSLARAWLLLRLQAGGEPFPVASCQPLRRAGRAAARSRRRAPPQPLPSPSSAPAAPAGRRRVKLELQRQRPRPLRRRRHAQRTLAQVAGVPDRRRLGVPVGHGAGAAGGGGLCSGGRRQLRGGGARGGGGREGGGARDEGVRSGRLRRRLLPRRPLINPNAKRSPLPAGVPAAPRAEAARRPVGGGAGAWVRVRPQDARARRVGAGTRARRAGRRAPRQPLQAPHAGSKHPAAPSASGLPARGRCQRTGAAAARPRPCPRCGLLLELPMTRYEVIRLDLEKRTGKPAVPRGPSPSGKQGSCVAG